MKRVIVATVLLCSGCVISNSIQSYAPIDATSKTITVPTGSYGLLGILKTTLSEHGWRLAVYRGPEVIQGSTGTSTQLEKYDTFHTRYTLVVSSSKFDVCLDFSPMVAYDISLVDNESGAEVLTMSGRDCEATVAKAFASKLD